MESLLDVFKILKSNAWMESIELKDVFKFEWGQKVYKFVGISNRNSDVMRVFKKILKLIYANLSDVKWATNQARN